MTYRSSLGLLVAFCSIATAAACGSSSDDNVAHAPVVDGSTPPAEDGGATPEADADAPVDGPVAPEGSSAACVAPAAGFPAGTTAGTVTVSGVARTFRVHVPPSYVHGKATPVVLMLHGGGGSALQLETQSAKMDPIADREGFITLYPDGVGVVKTSRRSRVRSGSRPARPRAPVPVFEVHGSADSNVPYAGGVGRGPSAGVVFTSVPDTIEGWRTRNGCSAATLALPRARSPGSRRVG